MRQQQIQSCVNSIMLSAGLIMIQQGWLLLKGSTACLRQERGGEGGGGTKVETSHTSRVQNFTSHMTPKAHEQGMQLCQFSLHSQLCVTQKKHTQYHSSLYFI